MQPAASGIYKQVAFKLNAGAFGAAPGQASAQLLRRTASTVDLQKDTYQSNEIRPDFQVADFRHGVRRVGGQISGELSCATWKDFIAMALKRDFTAGISTAGVGLTIAAGAGSTWTVTRSAGNYLTDGFKVGRVVRLSVGALNALNLSKNLLLVALTSTVATVLVVNATSMQAEGPVAGCTVTEVGKSTWIPQTGHTDKDFGLEHFYADLVQSELFLGNKVDKISFGLPPTGMATVTMDIIGQDLAETSAKRGGVAPTAQYFTAPTAVTTTGVMAAVNGVLRAGGQVAATLTGLTLDVDPTFSGDPVVGSNVIPQLFPGKVMVSGQFTAYFDSVAMRDAFVNETEIDLLAVFTADNTAAADFIAFSLPRLKVGGASKSDSDAGLVQTFPFTALLNNAGGAGIATEKTTICVQDAQA